MWPRGDVKEGPGNDRRSKGTNLSGFVAFKRRKDAETALRELDGSSWGGSTLRVGWSKAVTTSGRVIYGAVNFLAICYETHAVQAKGLRDPGLLDENKFILTPAHVLVTEAESDIEIDRIVETHEIVIIAAQDLAQGQPAVNGLLDVRSVRAVLVEFLPMKSASLR